MAGQLTIDTLRASSGVLATQNGMTGIAKAWVNFVGSTAVINGSFNVSLITRNSTGNYTVTFTTAMTNANYAVAGMSGDTAFTASDYARSQNGKTWATGSFTFVNEYGGGAAADAGYQCIVIFGA